MGRGEPAFGGEGGGRAEVEGMVVGCVVGDADFDLRGKRWVSGGSDWNHIRIAYVCWDEMAADGCSHRRCDTADALRHSREHSHAFFQTGREVLND